MGVLVLASCMIYAQLLVDEFSALYLYFIHVIQKVQRKTTELLSTNRIRTDSRGEEIRPFFAVVSRISSRLIKLSLSPFFLSFLSFLV